MNGTPQPGAGPELDEHGFLRDWNDWTAELARAMAQADGIELTEDHWRVIEILRDYYAEFEIAPPMRALVQILQGRVAESGATSRALYRLFPEGPAKQGCRYAGLPKPVSCI
jgi:tRNA 2-thiouridine synthesizing protein E